LIKPLLSALGADTSSIESAFKELEILADQIRDSSTIPDRFNDTFASRGWIMFERMNLEVVKSAIQEAEKGNLDKAEEVLVEYFNSDFVEKELWTMVPVSSFSPRMELTKKALEDYKAERYHASIPVVLAQIDGLVSDLHEKQRSFFAKDTKLEAWDSLAAHSKGLTRLSQIFRKGRNTTRTTQINIPYRHGIMHGRDLGYANKMVAAKTWAALFAVREWAIKVERGITEPPEEDPPESIKETINSISESIREKERWENWTPRDFDFSKVGQSPDPSVFETSTPERALTEFLSWWVKNNFGYMCDFIPGLFTKYAEEPLPRMLREVYEDYKLLEYIFTEMDHSVPSITKIKVILEIETQDTIKSKETTFRMVCEDESGDMVAHGNPNGKWVVMNWNGLDLHL